MAQQRHYPDNAAKQRAYRVRQAQARCTEQEAKGLPAAPSLPTLPSRARWQALLTHARLCLERARDEMQSYYDDRSEAWQGRARRYAAGPTRQPGAGPRRAGRPAAVLAPLPRDASHRPDGYVGRSAELSTYPSGPTTTAPITRRKGDDPPQADNTSHSPYRPRPLSEGGDRPTTPAHPR